MEIEKKSLTCGQLAGICFIVGAIALLCNTSVVYFDSGRMLFHAIIIAVAYIPLAAVLLKKRSDIFVVVGVFIMLLSELLYGEPRGRAAAFWLLGFVILQILSNEKSSQIKKFLNVVWVIPSLLFLAVRFPFDEIVHYKSNGEAVRLESLIILSIYAMAIGMGYLLCCKWLVGIEKDLQSDRAEKTDGNAI